MAKKLISHWDRRTNPEYAPKVKPVVLNKEKRLRVYDEYDDKSGRVIRKSEYITIDRQKEMENYRCADFSLENMLSAGVDIRPTHLSSSGLSMLDNLETQVEKIVNSPNVKQSNN